MEHEGGENAKAAEQGGKQDPRKNCEGKDLLRGANAIDALGPDAHFMLLSRLGLAVRRTSYREPHVLGAGPAHCARAGLAYGYGSRIGVVEALHQISPGRGRSRRNPLIQSEVTEPGF